ncbi:pentatricopeptide repeat-containing protein 2, mitochondrial-like [Orussus abietinus]|uniref:pentatricopeptide repeat-containing protein 2, mitochondrial-like n=1 Tax=Orussus abietinus TaxID=222816 RepID=UPI000626D95B|nr:pentatricopeptide repeat-containing protein 2, mitochondrial-like [Orussus abietinus]
MAGSLRNVFRLNLGLLSSTLSRCTSLNVSPVQGFRLLYTQGSIGMNGYLKLRGIYHKQFLNVETTFRDKMKEFVEDNSSNMIFTEDLKAMLHLVEKSPEDIELLVKMLRKFNSQNKELRFGNFIFGPVVMRTMYHLDVPDITLELFHDPEFHSFFNQFISYQILMDMLYNHGRFDDVRKVYDSIKERRTDNIMYPRHATNIVTAACLRQNTPDSFEYVVNIAKEMKKNGLLLPNRTIGYIATLALKQGFPEVALEMSSMHRNMKSISCRCIRVASFARLNRLNSIIPIIRNSLDSDHPTFKEMYFKDVIEMLDEAVQRSSEDQLKQEVQRLLKEIINRQSIREMTLEQYVLSEIDLTLRNNLDGETDQNQLRSFRRPMMQRKTMREQLI